MTSAADGAKKELPSDPFQYSKALKEGAKVGSLDGYRGEVVGVANSTPGFIFTGGNVNLSNTGVGSSTNADGVATAAAVIGGIVVPLAGIGTSVFGMCTGTKKISTDNKPSAVSQQQNQVEDKETASVVSDLNNALTSASTLNDKSKEKDLQNAVQSLTTSVSAARAKRQSLDLKITEIATEISGYNNDIKTKKETISNNNTKMAANEKSRKELTTSKSTLEGNLDLAQKGLASIAEIEAIPEEDRTAEQKQLLAKKAEYESIVKNYPGRIEGLTQEIKNLDDDDTKLKEENKKAQEDIDTNIPAKIKDAEGRKSALQTERNTLDQPIINAEARITTLNGYINAKNK